MWGKKASCILLYSVPSALGLQIPIVAKPAIYRSHSPMELTEHSANRKGILVASQAACLWPLGGTVALSYPLVVCKLLN